MTWDPEALSEQCNQAMAESSSRSPEDFGWGLFAYGDAPPAVGGGVGVFQWFQDCSDLLVFVSDLSAAGFATYDDEAEWLELRDRLRRIAAGFEEKPEAAIKAFNRELASLLQISWIGRIENLLGGDEPFAAIVRARFRGDLDDTPSPASVESIKPEEKELFMAYLADYGA